jgi:hypothetical protein
MRTYGRNYGVWQVVETDADGFDDAVWLTTMCQVFLLNLNESPFYANYGLPAQQSVIQQVQPDYYVARIQQQFAQHFASLVVAKVPNATSPTYRVSVITQQGSKIILDVPT